MENTLLSCEYFGKIIWCGKMTKKPETAKEALQTILGDLTVEEFNNIITHEINKEIIRKLYPSSEDNK